MNKYNKYLVFILSFILVFSLFCFPSFADMNIYPIKSSEYNASLVNTSESNTYSFVRYDTTHFGGIYFDETYSTLDSAVDSYLFMIPSQGSLNNGYAFIIALSRQPSSNETFTFRFSKNINTSQGQNIKSANVIYDSTTDLWFYTGTIVYDSSLNYYCPIFNSVGDGLAKIAEARNNASTGVPAFVNVSAGNVAYIAVSEGNAEFYISNVPKFTGTYSSNIRYGSSQTLPEAGSTFSFSQSYGTAITFSGLPPFDILSRTTNGYFRLTDLSPQYIVVYNPLYDNNGNVNPTVRVELDNLFIVVQYPLTSTINNGTEIASGSANEFYIAMDEDVSPSGDVNYIYYRVDDNDEQVTSGAITVPVGGNNYIDIPEDDSIGGLLDRILSIFKAPINYIRSLFDNGSTFMSWLSNLFAWLPEPVQSVITSALVVLIVVGVVKFLWK